MQISWNDKILNSLKKQKSFTKYKKILKPVLYNSRYLRTKFSS